VTVNATGTYKLYKNGDLNAVYANPSNAIPASATRNSNYIGKSNFYPQDAYFIGIFAYMQMWEVYIYILKDASYMLKKISIDVVATLTKHY
jgi:hypothetical protein